MWNPLSFFSPSSVSTAATMMSPFISAINPIAGAAVGAVGSYYGAQAQAEASQKAFKNQVALTKMNQEYQTSERLAAQEYNTTMWNAQNEYNSIGSQIERAKAAGVNPNAVLGITQGNLASTPAASHGQTGGIAGAVPPAFGDAQARTAQMAALNADIANKAADTANKDADTDNKRVTRKILDETLQQAANKTLRDQFEYTVFVDKSLKELEMMKKQLDILSKEYDIKSQTYENLKTSGNYDKLKYEFAKALKVPVEASDTDKLLYDYISGDLDNFTNRLVAVMSGDMAANVDDAIGKIYDTLASFLPTDKVDKVVNVVKNVFGSGNTVKQ